MNALSSGDFTEADDPFALFALWQAEAAKREPNDPDAMTLASVDANGAPDARVVLCKGADARGFVFYTNAESAKGRELAASPKAAAVFHWKSLRRQVRVRGSVGPASEAEADAYFATRSPESRIAAWASQQSRALESRAKLEEAVASIAKKFADRETPRPPFWRGYRLTPVEIEFWQDGKFRLHDRVVFTRAEEGAPWRRQRLYP